MSTPRLREEELPPAINEAVAVLIALSTSIHDWHREVFQGALSDLLQKIRKTPSVIRPVRCVLATELNIPYCPKWRVSETEYEQRRRQVFLSLRQLHGTLNPISAGNS